MILNENHIKLVTLNRVYCSFAAKLQPIHFLLSRLLSCVVSHKECFGSVFTVGWGKGWLGLFCFFQSNCRVTLLPSTSAVPLPSDTLHEFGPEC